MNADSVKNDVVCVERRGEISDKIGCIHDDKIDFIDGMVYNVNINKSHKSPQKENINQEGEATAPMQTVGACR